MAFEQCSCGIDQYMRFFCINIRVSDFYVDVRCMAIDVFNASKKMCISVFHCNVSTLSFDHFHNIVVVVNYC